MLENVHDKEERGEDDDDPRVDLARLPEELPVATWGEQRLSFEQYGAEREERTIRRTEPVDGQDLREEEPEHELAAREGRREVRDVPRAA